MRIKLHKFGPIIVVAIVSFFIGFGISYAIKEVGDSTSEKKYPLLARRVQLDDSKQPQVNFTNLRSQLESYVSSQGEESKDISVYFEYLSSGVSININERNEAIGASLMKVPIIMTLFKASSEGKVDLDKKVSLKQEWLNDEYGELYKKGVGHEISIRDAARLAMKDSDNTAVLLITSQIESMLNGSNGVIRFLDLEFELNSDERVLIGARSYSSILKCLYLACYNTKEDSEEILRYLTESTFDNRLTLSTPDNLVVAHKIGTFSKEYQSDCGIVYLENRNYLLCVMIKGEDPQASVRIGRISQITYDFVNSLSLNDSN